MTSRRETPIKQHDPEIYRYAKSIVEIADVLSGEWVSVFTQDDRMFTRIVAWLVYSKNSPFEWSPQGRTKSGRAYTLMWETELGKWSPYATAPARSTFRLDKDHPEEQYRLGMLKMRTKRRITP